MICAGNCAFNETATNVPLVALILVFRTVALGSTVASLFRHISSCDNLGSLLPVRGGSVWNSGKEKGKMRCLLVNVTEYQSSVMTVKAFIPK